MTNLYDMIGGEPAVEAAVDRLYQRILGDATINGFFAHIDMAVQRSKMRKFLTLLLSGRADGAHNYMEHAHAGVVAAGLNDAHFDAVAGHLQATLQELGVPDNLVETIMAAAAGLRPAVLGRTDAVVAE